MLIHDLLLIENEYILHISPLIMFQFNNQICHSITSIPFSIVDKHQSFIIRNGKIQVACEVKTNCSYLL